MKIPKTFKLGALTYTVSMVNHIDKGESLGISDTDAGTIQIMRDITRQRKEQTYCNELIHCILSIAGREDLSTDECLVDVLATFLHQHNETQKGDQK